MQCSTFSQGSRERVWVPITSPRKAYEQGCTKAEPLGFQRERECSTNSIHVRRSNFRKMLRQTLWIVSFTFLPTFPQCAFLFSGGQGANTPPPPLWAAAEQRTALSSQRGDSSWTWEMKTRQAPPACPSRSFLQQSRGGDDVSASARSWSCREVVPSAPDCASGLPPRVCTCRNGGSSFQQSFLTFGEQVQHSGFF